MLADRCRRADRRGHRFAAGRRNPEDERLRLARADLLLAGARNVGREPSIRLRGLAALEHDLRGRRLARLRGRRVRRKR